MVMEYLSRALTKLNDHKQFKYHLMCNRLNIIHFSFVDDLLLFSRGDLQSVTLMHDTFKIFTTASNLQANLSKSPLYFGGVTNNFKVQI